MKHKILTGILASLCATASFAQDSGFFLGVGAGQFNIKIDDVTGTQDFDSDDTVYKIFGGYRFNPYFSVELDYIDLGSPKDTVLNVPVTASINGFAPYAVATIPLGPIELFGRVGYYFYDVEVKGNAVVKDSNEDLVYGVGVGLTFFEKLHTRLEYEFFDIDDVDSSNALWLSVAWRF